jgi:hypothetical protein
MINGFLAQNPAYELVERLRYVIWETTMTTSGLVLRNRMYPIQIPTTSRDVTLPGVCYVPNIIHGKPEGFIDVIEQDLINFALCASEEQYQLFSSGGKYVVADIGAVDDPNTLRDEVQNRIGIINKNPGMELRIEPQIFNSALTQHYENLYRRIQEYSGMTSEIQGRMQAGSSNYRTRMSILQSMSSHSPYIRNLTQCDVNLTNIILYLFTLTTTDEELFAVFDKAGDDLEIKTNQVEPQKIEGVWKLVRVMNDLRRGKFKYMITEQSSSALNREMEQEEHEAYMQGAGGHLMQTMIPIPGGIEVVANLFRQNPNSFTKRYGEALEDSLKKQKNEIGNAQSGEVAPLGLPAPQGEQPQPQQPQGIIPAGENMQDLEAVENKNMPDENQSQNMQAQDGQPQNYQQELMNNLMNNQ